MSILTNIKGKLTIKNARAQIAKEFGYSDYNSLINDLNQSPETNQQLITNI